MCGRRLMTARKSSISDCHFNAYLWEPDPVASPLANESPPRCVARNAPVPLVSLRRIGGIVASTHIHKRKAS